VASAPASPQLGAGSQLAAVYFSPRDAFASILARPRFWLPLVGWTALGIGLAAVWMPRVDVREFSRNQLQQSGRAEKMDPAQVERALDMQTRVFKPFVWTLVVLAPIVTTLVVGLALFFIFRFFYAAELTYAQSLAVVAWSFFAVALVTTPLVLLVMSLKGDWNVPPEEAVQASVAMFLDRPKTARPLYVLASSLDLFSFWILWLLSSGFAVASRRTTGAAAAGTVGLWTLYVLGKVAVGAAF